MKDRTLYGLICAAIVMLIVSYLLYGHVRSRSDAFVPGGELLSGLDIDQVAKISIQDQKGQVTLVKDKDGFVLEEKSRYPASNAQVNEFFKQCATITLAEKVTDDPDKYDDLGVQATEEENEGDAGGESVIVTLSDRADKPLAAFIVGNRKDQPAGRYVRLMEKPTVYFTKSSIRFMTDYKHYIERNLLDLDPEEVKKVVVNTGRSSYVITADEEGQPVLDTLPPGKKAQGSTYKQVFRALAPLFFSDFYLASDEAVSGLTFDKTYTAYLQDQRRYQLDIAERDGDYYVRVAAATDLPTRMTIEKDETEEELRKKDEILQLHESIKTFNEFSASWVFKLDQHVGEKLTKTLDELVE